MAETAGAVDLSNPIELLRAKLGPIADAPFVKEILNVLADPNVAKVATSLASNARADVLAWFDQGRKMSPAARVIAMKNLTPEARQRLLEEDASKVEHVEVDQKERDEAIAAAGKVLLGNLVSAIVEAVI